MTKARQLSQQAKQQGCSILAVLPTDIIPESYGVDFDGFPLDDGSGIAYSETLAGREIYEVLDTYTDETKAAAFAKLANAI